MSESSVRIRQAVAAQREDRQRRYADALEMLARASELLHGAADAANPYYESQGVRTARDVIRRALARLPKDSAL